MQALRRSKRLVTLVLAWWVLFVGAAGATAWVKPAPSQMVCSAGGVVQWLALDADEGDAPMAKGMDCPLCITVLPLPPVGVGAFALPDDLAHAMRPMVAARIAALTAPPLPSRGPPI